MLEPRRVTLLVVLQAIACGEPDDPEADASGGTAASSTGPDLTLWQSRTVFITKETFDGNLGGLAGADAHCQRLADQAGLAGTYQAWLSDSLASPATRMVHGLGFYRLVDGTLLALDWGDLRDGSIEWNISMTADGSFVFDPVEAWTNTRANGTVVSPSFACDDWTTADGLPTGGFGRSTARDEEWTHADGTNCDTHLRLYCFEQ